MNGDQELNEILKNGQANFTQPAKIKRGKKNRYVDDQNVGSYMDDDDEIAEIEQSYVQWSSCNGQIFLPANKTKKKLTPGVYEIDSTPNTGLYFEKITVKTENLLRFPDSASDIIVEEIQKFWSPEVEAKFVKHQLTYKRGLLLWGPPGCHAAGTRVLMYNGSTKKVEDVVVGDELMGPDSNPKRVLELCRGKDEMHKIVPDEGKSFVVNGHHIFSLMKTEYKEKRFNLTVNDYLALSKYSQRSFKLSKKDHNFSTEIKEIIHLGIGDYYGFTLSGDHLYLTDDFIIHHNSGKSCALQIIMADVIERGGVVIKFDEPNLFLDGMRILRCIQPETPVVVIMEDIDSILEMYNESEVLNILDGVNDVQRTVFLGTTNYPRKLGARVVNRPSRFDRRVKIDYPSPAARKMYFESLMGSEELTTINLEKWVAESGKFSIAHLKELFISVIVFGNDFDKTVETLRSMKEEIDDRDDGGRMGFGPETSMNDG